jgi:hypothetical protein
MRTITTHASASCSLTAYAAHMCQILNEYKYSHPNSTFCEMAKWYRQTYGKWLSESSIARYYYGYHALNVCYGQNYNRVREGVKVTL